MKCRAPFASCFVSHLTSVYENLALESWLLRFFDFTERDALLIWRDQPCVVIGRHQNPWLEANQPFLEQNKIALARRQSGGGTVYHDLNNVNCSFLTLRDRHSRQRNLEFMSSVVRQCFSIELSSNKKHDLLLNGVQKVSGTAAKLISKSAYHHLTLLLNVDRERMHLALAPSIENLSNTSATKSIRSEVAGLVAQNPVISYDRCVNELVYAFRQLYEAAETTDVTAIGPQQYPGITETLAELQSWEWIFGMTPSFNVNIIDQQFTVHVEKGVIDKIVCDLSASRDASIYAQTAELIGLKYRPELFSNPSHSLLRPLSSIAI